MPVSRTVVIGDGMTPDRAVAHIWGWTPARVCGNHHSRGPATDRAACLQRKGSDYGL